MDYTGLVDHPNHAKQGRSLGGQFSMVKDTNRPTAISAKPRNKYDPGSQHA